MNNNELFMNDTFDNFTFVETEQLLSKKESEKAQNNTQDILLDDSCFLTQPDQNKKNEQNSWSEDFFSTTDFASQHSPANKQKVSSESSEEEPTGQTVINKNSDNNNQIQINTVFSSSESNEINFCSIDFSESFELDSVKINVDYKISDSESGKVICDGIGDKSAEILSALCCDNVNSTFVVCNKKVREKFSSQPGTKNTNPNNLKCNQNVLSEKRKHSESDNEDEPNRRVKSPKLIEDEILKPNNEKYNFPNVKTAVTCCDKISQGPSKDEVQTKKYTDKRLHFLDNENIEKTNYDDNEKDNIDNVEDKSQICLKIKTAKPTDDYAKHEESNDNKTSPNIIVNIDNVKNINSQQSHENDNPQKKIFLKGDPIQLSSWGLPEIVLEKYKARHIENMFEWQVECLSNKKVIESCSNLIYSAPTSAGKTLVSEILAIKTIFERQKKVIFILPFVSIVREKMYYFQDILGSSGIRVEGFMGSYNPPGGFQAVQMAICTMEKANSLINRLLEEGKLGDIGAIIVDEMHLLGDISRGYLLELLLTKLKYISLHDPDIKIQIIGMSATLPNLSTLAKWLDAELYTTTFRPIPLEELAHVSGEIYNTKFELIRKIEPLQDVGADTDNILQLCLETVKTSCSVLIFCPTKNWCESLAQQISVAFLKLGKSKTDLGNMLRDELKPNMIIEVMEQLKYCPAGLDDVLKKTVSFGVAYHHAGLTMEERDIIEGGFRSGAIRVLIATSTLSSGVNLPARRVIVRSPTFHGKPIDVLTYKQMIGRAGRMGKDEKGESILICQKNDYQIAKELMQAHLKPVCSCLEGAGKLKRAILEVITSKVATSPEDVSLFTNCTLLAVENEEQSEHLENPIEEAVNFLRNNEFIKLQASENGTQKYVATSLGKACLSSSMAPDEGLALFTELEKARQCFVLETELHLIYLVTPYSACHSWGNIDWMFYLQLWERLPASMKRVGELVGVRESYLVNATRGQIQTQTNKQYHKLLIHKRFFVALALQDLVNEKTLGEVCAKFNCNRGMLQSLQQSASSFAGMVTAFSKQLGWTSVEILISQFQDRLQFGVSRDLLDLMRLPILNGKIARALYNGGMETLIQLANSDVMTIENTLNTVMPFEREKEREGESEYEARRRNKIKNVWISGREGLTVRETAEILIHDARNYLKMEMGLADAKWEDQNEAEKLNNKEQEQRKIDSTLHQESSNHDIGEDKEQNFNEQQHENNVDKSQDKENHDIGEDKEQNLNEQQHENNVDQSQVKEENLICDYKDVESDSSQFSVFNESFTLQLSSDSLTEDNSPAQTDKQEVEIKNVCSALETLINESNNMNMSDDIFTESFDESKSPLNKISRTNLNDAVTDANMPKQKIVTKNINLPSCSKTNVTYIEDAIEKFSIIDVCGNDILFEKFCGDLLCVSSFSLSVGCTETEEDGKEVKKVEGIAISWGDTVVYYLSLENHLKQRVLQLLKTVIEDRTLNIKIFDCKEQVKCLKKYCNLDIYGDMEDPKIADWLLEPEEAEKNLDNLAMLYYPQVASVLKLLGTRKGVGSVGLEVRTAIHSKLRCCVESLVTWYVSDALKSLLLEKSAQFLNVYGVEMKCCLLLAKMEIAGMGVSRVKLQKLADDLRQQMENIERKCFSLTGRRFSLSSPIEVSRILGMHKGKKVSTRKEVLEKCDHPVAGLIIQWRKISFTMTKVIYPFIQTAKVDRLFGCYITHTATGRITMHEPNIQTIPKNFDIVNPLTKETCVMSCRTAFAAAENCSLVSADWCQLELRLLAHLSQDKILKKIMNSPGDVFKSVASKWYNVSESDVDDKLRQNAKHICYGIIYGMGYKTLAEQLSISEEDAMEFMESFKNAYPGVQVYIQKTIEECKRNGYVETISGRRRYLAHIKDSNVVLRGQAERQAVNTTIQGSAADMAKKAMITIDEKLIKTFCKSKLKPNLVLHLHDELIYEVPTKYIHKVAKIVKNSMENAVKLTVPFPVKLRVGLSWGELTEYSL